MSLLVHNTMHQPLPLLRGKTVLRGATAMVATVLAWPLRVHANRKLLNQMAGMSAYELADIGLTPGDLQDTAALALDTEIGGFLATRANARHLARVAAGKPRSGRHR